MTSLTDNLKLLRQYVRHPLLMACWHRGHQLTFGPRPRCVTCHPGKEVAQ